MTRDELFEKVIAQIEYDIRDRDYTAIEELLRSVTDEQLQAFLPEETV